MFRSTYKLTWTSKKQVATCVNDRKLGSYSIHYRQRTWTQRLLMFEETINFRKTLIDLLVIFEHSSSQRLLQRHVMLLVFREVTNEFISKIRKITRTRTKSPRKARKSVRRIQMAKLASTNQKNGGHCLRKSETESLRYKKSPRHPQLVLKRLPLFPVFRRRSVIETIT
jgi:hypothetical protein